MLLYDFACVDVAYRTLEACDGLSYVEGEVINVVGRSSETIGIYSKTCGITYAKASACDQA
jgi:hypothetical protein